MSRIEEAIKYLEHAQAALARAQRANRTQTMRALCKSANISISQAIGYLERERTNPA